MLEQYSLFCTALNKLGVNKFGCHAALDCLPIVTGNAAVVFR